MPLLEALRDGLAAALPDNLLALYLHGSLTLGDFQEAWSDIDFLAVLRSPLTSAEIERIIHLHSRLRRRYPLAWRLEGAYVPGESLQRWRAKGTWQGVVQFDPQDDLSPDNLLAIRQRGITLFGPPPRRLIPALPRRLLTETMLAFLQEYRDRYETSPLRSLTKVVNDALNVCRSLYALRTGRIVSKTAGGQWALETFDQRWHELIHTAMTVRQGDPVAAAEELLREQMPGFTHYAWRQVSSPDFRSLLEEELPDP